MGLIFFISCIGKYVMVIHMQGGKEYLILTNLGKMFYFPRVFIELMFIINFILIINKINIYYIILREVIQQQINNFSS